MQEGRMTDSEFDKAQFYKGMLIMFCGDKHEIGGVDFARREILVLWPGGIGAWTPARNCTLIPQGYHDVDEFYAEKPNFTREV
jgi:hypothetical protein